MRCICPMPTFEKLIICGLNSQGLFSSGNNGPFHSEIQTAGITFDFHQLYLNNLSYLGNGISASCQYFQKQFLMLWFHGSFNCKLG